MRILNLAGLLVWVMLSLLASGQSALIRDDNFVKVYLHNPEDIITLRQLHLQDEPGLEGSTKIAYVMLNMGDYDRLKASGLEYVLLNPTPFSPPQSLTPDATLESYHTYSQLVALADSLALHFPSICKKILLGTSPQGRQYGILKISDNVNADENEAEIMFDGGIHGDEIMGPELVIRYARELCLGYGTNPTYTDLINTREIWLYYLVNPDGFVAVSRYNSNGVDCNRDVGFMWGGEGYSPFPFSQPETRILRDLWLEHNFTVYTNLHGGTEVISYPWSYRISATPDHTHINQLASVYSSSSGYYNLGYGQGCNIMYQIFGATKDFNYGVLGQVGWSIEITQQKQPPASQIPMYVGYNMPAMTEMINRCGWGIEGLITDSVTGSPVRAAVFVGSYYPVYTQAALGDFHKYVLPGTYSLTVVASGYETKTVSGITVPAQGSVIANVTLTPASGRYAYRTIVTNIPYFPSSGNYPDESYVPGIIGPPDQVNYSLGRSGYIIIDMGDTIFNGTGNDFKIIEGDTSPEGYAVHVSAFMDGPWTSLGNGTGTTGFDLASGPVSEIRYIKITDDGDGATNANDAGFDLDAVEILTPPLIADFTASNNTPCTGGSVNFTDLSTGTPTSWLWSFPGGNPSSSTLENPTNIVYDSAGVFDVSLTITNTYTQTTLNKQAFIHVYGPPPAPGTPAGPTIPCAGSVTQYTTSGSASATSFEWELSPPEAGTTNGVWMTCTVNWAANFTGAAQLKVRENTACGTGPFSDSLLVQVQESPVVDLGPDSLVCLGDSITLDAGNPGSDYFWSTGETTQTITIDTTGFGPGTHVIWGEASNISGCSDRDTILVTFDVCSVTEVLAALPDPELFPNPSTGVFHVKAQGFKEGTVTIFNQQGTPLIRSSFSDLPSDGLSFDLSRFPKGLYIVRLTSESHIWFDKLIIQ